MPSHIISSYMSYSPSGPLAQCCFAVQNCSVGGATDTTAWNLFLDAGGVAGWHSQTANIRLMALPPVVLLIILLL